MAHIHNNKPESSRYNIQTSGCISDDLRMKSQARSVYEKKKTIRLLTQNITVKPTHARLQALYDKSKTVYIECLLGG